MYKCECGKEFKEPNIVHYSEYSGASMVEDYSCPFCGSGNFDDIGDHDKDCVCGQCTGEDRALEIMEKGICECENKYEEDWYT